MYSVRIDFSWYIEMAEKIKKYKSFENSNSKFSPGTSKEYGSIVLC